MPEPRAVLREEKAWDVIYQEAKALGGKLELIATGPLTNLAITLAKYPDLPKYVKKLTVMGGGACFGNATPAAEFNIYADPEAAEMVFRSGMPIALCGLDVCHRAHLTEEEVKELEGFGTVQAAFCAALSRQELSWAVPYAPPAPPCTTPAPCCAPLTLLSLPPSAAGWAWSAPASTPGARRSPTPSATPSAPPMRTWCWTWTGPALSGGCWICWANMAVHNTL